VKILEPNYPNFTKKSKKSFIDKHVGKKPFSRDKTFLEPGGKERTLRTTLGNL